jgi:hypothetical protein
MDSTPTDLSLYPPQPATGIIRVHQATADRLVLDIPPGKGSGGIGCFAIVWNGFMTVFTTLMILAPNQNNEKPGVGLFLFLSLFWLIGLGFIYAWVKLRFERCFLLVDRDRAVLRRMLLGRQRQKELELDDSSRAQLTSAYEQNDQPVYRVTIVGAGGKKLQFGTTLAPTEKDWCVDAINALIAPASISPVPSVKSGPLICEACGAVLPVDAFRTNEGNVICPACEHQQQILPSGSAREATSEVLDDAPLPEELPGVVTMLEESPDRLGLRLGVTEYAALRGIVAAVAGGFAAFWYFVSLSALATKLWQGWNPAGAFDWFEVLFTIPFLLAGFMPLGLALLALFGRITTWVDRDRLTVRVHVGPLGKKWSMATPDITAVRITNRNDFPSNAQNPRIANRNPPGTPAMELNCGAAAFAGSRLLIMTLAHKPVTARFVVEKVRTWLRENVPDTKI